jgi:ribosomal protein S18 acetylase RimI-like enzyme
MSPLLQRIERYYDAVPRHVCDVEELGPFTLFASRGGWPFYARPSLARSDRPSGERFSADDVLRVRARQAALDLPQTFEWMVEAAPGLATACRDAGLEVVEYPLLVHRRPTAVPVPDGIRIRRLAPDDPAVAAGQVVASLGFASAGTTVGDAGPVERDAALEARDPAASDQLRRLMAEGRSVYVVAEDEHGVLCSGAHNPVDDVTEIVGVATLPSHRRRGLAAAVTDTLVADAMRRDVEVIFLSADGDDVARVYERVGFARVATAAAAEPPSG